jgi:sec-independent protein translocase protein TatA
VGNIKTEHMKFNIIAGVLGGQEILLILLIVVLLFGGRKIPELMRGLGKGVKEFKDATKNEQKDTEKKNEDKVE